MSGRIVKRGHGSRAIAGHFYPSRADYTEALGNEWLDSADLVRQAQMEWHGSGNNGCVFAQWLAKRVEPEAWASAAFPTTGVLSEDDLLLLDKTIANGLSDSSCEVLSLYFPRIETTTQLCLLLRSLDKSTQISLAWERESGDSHLLAYRVQLGHTEVLAWLMGFGPFETFPPTRRAPVTEIVIRCKQNPDEIFHRLNQDRDAAHLADYPAQLRPNAWERVWTSTMAKTREVLGGEPDEASAAKVTFSIPAHQWRVA